MEGESNRAASAAATSVRPVLGAEVHHALLCAGAHLADRSQIVSKVMMLIKFRYYFLSPPATSSNAIQMSTDA